MNTLVINSGSKAFSKEPSFNGITESSEKIWSSNTGRTSSGKMTGDIVAIKKKLVVKYPPLTDSEKNNLEKAVDDAFFTVTYRGKEYTMYAGSPSFPLYSLVNGFPRYIGTQIELIEQ